MDAVVVAFATALSWATAILFAFVPALRTSRVPLVAVMKEEGHATGAVRSRTRSALVVVQVAAALLLLVSAGLMMRTVEAAGRADLGFDPSDTVSIRLDLATSGYDENRGRLFYEQLLERLRQTPGVDSASVADVVPLRFVEGSSGRVEAEGYEASPDEDMRIARNVVGPDYFSVLRIGLVTGREFTAADQPGTEPVVVVNETLARRFWQTPQGAIGKRLLVGGDDGEWRTVVGVARDLKYLTLNEGATPYFYMPFSQIYRAEMTVHARGSNGAAALIEPVRSEIARLDANVPVVEARTLAEQARTGTFLYEGAAGVLVAFGVIALLLASVGLYGLVAYTARQRTHEIGIRMAVGAARAEIVRLVLRSGLRLGVVGTAVGIVIALAVTRLMRAMLFGVSAVDPMAFGVALFVVLGAVLLAALGPAMRAARIDPIVALKRQ